MPFYTFHLLNESGAPLTLDAKAFPDDGAAFDYAERMLERHGSCHHVDIWCGERSVAARHRDQPILRPVDGPERIATQLIGHPAKSQPITPPT